VFTQIIRLELKSSGTLKNRPITASSPIHTAQSSAKLKIKTGVLDNLFSFSGFLKRKLMKVKERRRLIIPIRDAEKRSPNVITMMPKARRRVFPSRAESL
jgi:hypothetical protein